MSTCWEEKKLKSILKLEYGKPLDVSHRSPNGLYPAYGANGEKTRTNKFYFDNPSIIVGRKGSAGEITLTEEKFWPLDVTYFVTFNEKEHDLRFLYYLLSKLELPKLAKGVKPGINRNDVYAKKVNVPNVQEQKRIVALLDKAFEAIDISIENTEKNLHNARELFQSYLDSIFSEDINDITEIKIGDVCEMLNGFAFKSKDAVSGSNTQLLRMGNLYNNTISFERRPVFYPDEFSIEYNKFLIKEGDLVISLTGTVGKEDYGYVVKIPKHSHNLLLNQRIAKFNIKEPERVASSYLLYYLRSRLFLKILYSTSNGTRQANLSSETILKLPFPLRPIAEQHKILKSIEGISKNCSLLESIYQKKRSAFEELKKSLLHQAFSGEL